MKENTKRLLVWLYTPADQSRLLTKTQMLPAVPALTSAGLQSTLYQLTSKKVVMTMPLAATTGYGLTHYGKELVESLFPALSSQRRSWQGTWTIVVGIRPPKTDANFRYLRETLLNQGCLSLARAVFLYPGSVLPPNLQSLLKSSYHHAVAVFNNGEWAVGDELEVIGQKLQLFELHHALSGVSREVEELLAKKTSINTSVDQPKLLISSVFDRFYGLLRADLGLVKHYFPQVESAFEILQRLQLLG